MAAVHPTSGATLPFRTPVDGQVWDLEAGAGGTVWIAGDFRVVAGRKKRGVAQLEGGTGEPRAFRPSPGVSPRDLALSGARDRLYVAAAGAGGRAMAYDVAGSGRLLWDVPVDGDMQAIDVTQRHVFVGGDPRAAESPSSPPDHRARSREEDICP